MFSLKRNDPPHAPEDVDVDALRDSVRVLGEVVRHLAERIEILEARATLTRHRPSEGSL